MSYALSNVLRGKMIKELLQSVDEWLILICATLSY